jgi:hypothetical protein
MARPDRSRSALRSLSALIDLILLIVVAASASGCNLADWQRCPAGHRIEGLIQLTGDGLRL